VCPLKSPGKVRPHSTRPMFLPAQWSASGGVSYDGSAWLRACSSKNRSNQRSRTPGTTSNAPTCHPFSRILHRRALRCWYPDLVEMCTLRHYVSPMFRREPGARGERKSLLLPQPRPRASRCLIEHHPPQIRPEDWSPASGEAAKAAKRLTRWRRRAHPDLVP